MAASYAAVLKGGLPPPSEPESSAPSEPSPSYAEVAARNTHHNQWAEYAIPYPTMHSLLEWSSWWLDEDGNELGT